jgi:hypothetical protein
MATMKLSIFTQLNIHNFVIYALTSARIFTKKIKKN